LRTPLHAIIGFAEMLQEDASETGNDGFLTDLGKITSSARHLVGLIGNILDLSKIEAGKMDLFLENFEVEPLFEEVVTALLPLMTESGNTLNLQYKAHPGVIHADAAKVRQVLFNLLSNANKFTERGSIALEVSRVGEAGREFLRFSVTDTGIGIAPYQKEK